MKRQTMGKRLHKWIGIPLCFLLFMAALSGILTNHRDLIRSMDIPRWLLPSGYQITNWNNAALRGICSADGQYYLYGVSGVWRTEDSTFRKMPSEYNGGLPKGADYRRVISIAPDSLGDLWLITQYGLYKERADHQGWLQQDLPKTLQGRLSDLQLRGDSLVLMSRSHIYTKKLGTTTWHEYTLHKAQDHVEGMLLFQLVWVLHSGEYLGMAGRIIVDLIGLILMLLSVTGIVYTCTSWRLKSRLMPTLQAPRRKRLSKLLAQHFSWHNAWGRRFFGAMLFICITGWMLRPPLMLGLLHHRLTPWRISHLYSDNPWHDRLRTLRYDATHQQWILHTSVGFYTLSSWDETPKKWSVQPPVSPMGINLMSQRPSGQWVIGSFSGLFTIDHDKVRDYFTEEEHKGQTGNPFAAIAITGGQLGDRSVEDRLFSYDAGAIKKDAANSLWARTSFAPEPKSLIDSPFSLWQWALEVHTGRIYQPLIGSIGVALFVFLLGLSSVIVLVTGYRRLRKS